MPQAHWAVAAAFREEAGRLTAWLVRILGDEKVTHVCTDDYHR